MSVDLLLGVLGGIIFAYATYYMINYHAILKVQEEEFPRTPTRLCLGLVTQILSNGMRKGLLM